MEMLFIHPPARIKNSKHTLDADVGFTDQFVSFPVGFFSMGDKLDRAGFEVKIMNLGEMIFVKRQSIDYFLEELFAKYEIEVVGIDIHWMIHSAGALATAKSIKKYSPLTKVVIGGITASYFAEEILEKFDFIDFVMVGECDNSIVDLVKELKMNAPDLNRVPNLAFRENGKIEKNPVKLPEISESLEILRYDLLMEEPVINPDRSIITLDRGCRRNCCFCSGAKESFGYIMKRKKPCCLKPSAIIRLIEKSSEMNRDKIYLYGDIRLYGKAYVEHFFRELNRSKIANVHLVIEFFTLADEDFVRQWKTWAVRSGSTLEATHSPESGNQQVRRIVGKNYTNQQLLEHCKLLVEYDIPQSIYLLLGLPGQSKATIEETLKLADKIVEIYASKFSRNDLRHEVVSFNFMQIPDAGSNLFRNPEAFGFHIDFKNIETLVHRITAASNWSDSVSFFTDNLSKQEFIHMYLYIRDTILKIYSKYRILPLQ
jgi:radical SAM superfamily enzyme YgiQ (UPF0313 family)